MFAEKDILCHYGTKRHSGRYPYGSGEDPFQHEANFYKRVNDMKAKGMSEKDICKALGMNTSEYRNRYSAAKDQVKIYRISEAKKLYNAGSGYSEIGRKFGVSESTVRSWLSEGRLEKAQKTNKVKDILKERVDAKKYIDVGVGSERYLNVSETKLKTAISELQKEGYELHRIRVKQLGTDNYTDMKVLCKPGTEWGEVNRNKNKIKMVTEYKVSDDGKTVLGIKPPQSISSDRIKIAYGDEGGSEKDGVIELRRNVKDLSLGNSNYAQVRIAVDGTHFLKGMAIYRDDMPKGVDVIFNTNKNREGNPNKTDVMKKLKDDPDNPFGASLKVVGGQSTYLDSKGKEHLSAINKVNEEGDWNKWSKTLSSQFLSKQSPELAKQQLGLAYTRKLNDFEDIMSLTNEAVKKKLLLTFADDCDSSAVHLKAAALPRQQSQVILPITTMKDTEVYAPNFRNGETVVLIRHPHGGKFEIPQLKVNNNQPDAKHILGNAQDAIGISSKVAERLSGADFDGDTVLVIPNNKKRIETQKALEGLKNFDPKTAYPKRKGMKVMTEANKQKQMGVVSNLITDMTLGGANTDEICRAVKHSMVVIDSVKHELDYSRSYEENGISELKKKYQKGGASTLISRAKSEYHVDERKEGGHILDPKTGEAIFKTKEGKPKTMYIDPRTGEKVYTKTNRVYTNKKGVEIRATKKSTRMAETKNAFDLSSGTRMENIYAEYANAMKKMGNDARNSYVNTPNISYSKEAKSVYANEVASLNRKLNEALKNAPLERQAQIVANSVYSSKLKANPGMDKDEKKKVKTQALVGARYQVGALSRKSRNINITQKEWDAIQAGAVSNNTLDKILNNTDLDRIRELATPKNKPAMTASKISRAKSMLASGMYTQAEVADALGVSISTLRNNL